MRHKFFPITNRASCNFHGKDYYFSQFFTCENFRIFKERNFSSRRRKKVLLSLRNKKNNLFRLKSDRRPRKFWILTKATKKKNIYMRSKWEDERVHSTLVNFDEDFDLFEFILSIFAFSRDQRTSRICEHVMCCQTTTSERRLWTCEWWKRPKTKSVIDFKFFDCLTKFRWFIKLFCRIRDYLSCVCFTIVISWSDSGSFY